MELATVCVYAIELCIGFEHILSNPTHTHTHTQGGCHGNMVQNYKLVVLGEGGVGKSGTHLTLSIMNASQLNDQHTYLCHAWLFTNLMYV